VPDIDAVQLTDSLGSMQRSTRLLCSRPPHPNPHLPMVIPQLDSADPFITLSMNLDDPRVSCSMGQCGLAPRNIRLQSVSLRSVPERCLKRGFIVILSLAHCPSEPSIFDSLCLITLHESPIHSDCCNIAPTSPILLIASDRFPRGHCRTCPTVLKKLILCASR
jgi:hypothetical protein